MLFKLHLAEIPKPNVASIFFKKKNWPVSSKRRKRCGRKGPGKIILWMKIVNFRFPLWSRLQSSPCQIWVGMLGRCLQFSKQDIAWNVFLLNQSLPFWWTIYQKPSTSLSYSAFCLVCHQIRISPSCLPGLWPETFTISLVMGIILKTNVKLGSAWNNRELIHFKSTLP